MWTPPEYKEITHIQTKSTQVFFIKNLKNRKGCKSKKNKFRQKKNKNKCKTVNVGRLALVLLCIGSEDV